jgi:predicted HicB family RNase H-like nuclease
LPELEGENGMDKENRQRATTGTLRIRGVSRAVHRAARLRAVSQGATLRWVVLQALEAYGGGTWTPSDKPPGSATNGI